MNYESEISTFRVLEKENFWKEAEMLDMKVSVLDEEESEEDEIRKMMSVPHLNGEGVYEEILPGIDLGKAYNLDEIEGIQKFIESLPGEIKQNIVKL